MKLNITKPHDLLHVERTSPYTAKATLGPRGQELQKEKIAQEERENDIIGQRIWGLLTRFAR